jgi:hypothetical protein
MTSDGRPCETWCAGVPEKAAMQLTGLQTRLVFDRYDIVTESDLQEGLEKLAATNGTSVGPAARPGKVERFRGGHG